MWRSENFASALQVKRINRFTAFVPHVISESDNGVYWSNMTSTCLSDFLKRRPALLVTLSHADCRTLSRVARCNRHLSELALDFQWEDIDSFSQLLELLPSIEYSNVRIKV
jgi:hypothetical protein